MRWKVILALLATLGAAHFLASPLITNAFDAVSRRFVQPELTVDKISLDLINGQATLKKTR